mmetsp:Transcript_56678/g.132744  ORF Transcript_56678/g.132744 Transcript_56678/m.132744 type:complete len:302 (-) Transcript_56678:125-1030(-)
MSLSSVEVLRASLQRFAAALAESSENFDRAAAEQAANECSANVKVLSKDAKALVFDARSVSLSAQRATKDTSQMRHQVKALESAAQQVLSADRREEVNLRQVLVQEALLQRSSEKLDALSVALRLGGTDLRGSETVLQNVTETSTAAKAPTLSPAQDFFSVLGKQTIQVHAVGQPPVIQDAGTASEPTSAASALQQLSSPSDVLASDVSLWVVRDGSAGSHRRYCCGFTTRRRGTCVRFRAEDSLPRADGQQTLQFSADLMLGDACEEASVRYHSSDIEAAELVREVFWSAIDRWKGVSST